MKKPICALRRKAAGFSLLELIVAIGILSIGAYLILVELRVGDEASMDARVTANATKVIKKRLDYLNRQPYLALRAALAAVGVPPFKIDRKAAGFPLFSGDQSAGDVYLWTDANGVTVYPLTETVTVSLPDIHETIDKATAIDILYEANWQTFSSDASPSGNAAPRTRSVSVKLRRYL